jgi:methylthioribulose-1-phosphate dehydratase
MTLSVDFRTQARTLVEAGRELHARGWVPATSGNFSARVDDRHVAVTVSGLDKGRLTEDDIMLVDMNGEAVSPGKRPSAETLLHTTLYRRHADVQIVLHTHSVAATVLSRSLHGALKLEGYELLKAFPGIDTHETRVSIPVFPNDQNMKRLSALVDRQLAEHSGVPAYLIAGHGLYTWARDARQVRIQVEALEFMFECELMRKKSGL